MTVKFILSEYIKNINYPYPQKVKIVTTPSPNSRTSIEWASGQHHLSVRLHAEL
jgi:hypothetical protein